MLDDRELVLARQVPERAGSKKPLPPKRKYSLDKKLQVVRETLAPGASVSVVARRHDINSNVVFRWRREYMHGELVRGAAEQNKHLLTPAFIPVGVVGQPGALRALPGPPKQEPTVQSQAPAEGSGVVEIETALGVKVRLTGSVDERLLDRVLAEIRRRP